MQANVGDASRKNITRLKWLRSVHSIGQILIFNSRSTRSQVGIRRGKEKKTERDREISSLVKKNVKVHYGERCIGRCAKQRRKYSGKEQKFETQAKWRVYCNISVRVSFRSARQVARTLVARFSMKIEFLRRLQSVHRETGRLIGTS